MKPHTPETFWSHVDQPEIGCWKWQLRKSRLGYGQVSYHGKEQLAHRIAWLFTYGPIPDGLTVDHICMVRDCVRPDHLQLLTLAQNILRGNGTGARHARQTHCLRGHEFDEANTYRWKGWRMCRACMRLREKAKRTQ